MNKNKVFIIPFTLPWDHSADYQKQTCLELKRRGYTVVAYLHDHAQSVYKKLDKTESKGEIEFYKPILWLPFNRIKAISQLNYLIDRFLLNLRFSNQKKYLWIFDPQFYNFSFGFTNKTSIYDCVDYQTSTTKNIDHQIRHMEKMLINNSDFFFVNSLTLKRIHQKNKLPKLVVQGVKVNNFTTNLSKTNVNSYPVIGYLGGLNHRLDFRLLINLITKNPQWIFEFWGPIQTDEQDKKYNTTKYLKILRNLPNTTWHYSKNHKVLSQALKNFDVAIIPYDVKQKVNYLSFPMKVFEYFLFGLPVVSTPIRELKVPIYNSVTSLAKNSLEFEQAINKFLIKKEEPEKALLKMNLAKKHSWQNKINQILSEILI